MNKNYCLFNHPNKHKVNRLLLKEIKKNVNLRMDAFMIVEKMK